MPEYETLRDLLDVALTIPDDYVRTVTLAKMGYHLREMGQELFSKAFKAALKSLDSVSSPILRVQAMMVVSEEMNRAGLKESGSKLLYRAYELAKALPQPIRDRTIADIVKVACALNVLADAVMYATDIEDRTTRMEVLTHVIDPLLRSGDLRRARNTLETMDEPWKSRAALKVLQAHLEMEQFASVLNLLPYLENTELLREAFRQIGIHLRKSEVPEGTYEKFIEAAMALRDRDPDIIITLLSTVASTGRINIVIQTLSDLGYPLDGILKVTGAVVDDPTIIKNFVDSLDIPQDKAERLYKFVMDTLLSKDASSKYLLLVLNIGQKTESEETLVKVVRYLTKLGELTNAYRFATLVEDPQLRSLAFGSIALALLRRGNVSAAIDAVGEVRDKRWSSWLMSEVIIKVLQLYSGKDIKEDFEESSIRQAERWKEDATGSDHRRLGSGGAP